MSRNILLAGCGDEAQQVLELLLDTGGFEVISVTQVSDAIGSILTKPLVIVVDLGMEHGLEVVKSARSCGGKAYLAVISSGTEVPGSNWIAKYRPDALFGKPLDFQDFVQWMSEPDIRGVALGLDSFNHAA